MPIFLGLFAQLLFGAEQLFARESRLLTGAELVASEAGASGRSVAVLFYAPWCAFSKEALPRWHQLAMEFDVPHRSGVTVARFDCSGGGRPLCKARGVEGFPTMRLLSSGAGSAAAAAGAAAEMPPRLRNAYPAMSAWLQAQLAGAVPVVAAPTAAVPEVGVEVVGPGAAGADAGADAGGEGSATAGAGGATGGMLAPAAPSSSSKSRARRREACTMSPAPADGAGTAGASSSNSPVPPRRRVAQLIPVID